MLLLRSIVKQNTRAVQTIRTNSTRDNNEEIKPIFTNRNPRNLEKIRIGYKPDGYHLEVEGRRFWHK